MERLSTAYAGMVEGHFSGLHEACAKPPLGDCLPARPLENKGPKDYKPWLRYYISSMLIFVIVDFFG